MFCFFYFTQVVPPCQYPTGSQAEQFVKPAPVQAVHPVVQGIQVVDES